MNRLAHLTDHTTVASDVSGHDKNEDALAPAAAAAAPASRRKRRGVRFDATIALAGGAALMAGVGVLAAMWAANLSHNRENGERDRTDAARLATLAAAVLGELCDAPATDTEAALARIGRHEGVRAVGWTDSTGLSRAAWPGARRVEPSDGTDSAVGAAEVRDRSGRSCGTVRVQLQRRAPQSATDPKSALAAAVTSAGVLALVWLGSRRVVRGTRAIETNLRDYACGVEQELLALSVSESLGEAARGWNRILSETVALRQELQVRSEVEKTSAILGRFDAGVFRRILDRLPIGVVRVSAAQKVCYANPAARSLAGPTPESLDGADANVVFDDESLRQALAGAVSGSHAGVTLDRSIKEGDREASLRYHVLPSAEGAGAEAVVLIEDLGQMRELERARDQFLYHVTHELRTPLTNIRAYVETLTRPDFDEEHTRKECYNVIVSETARLTRLIEDVLSVSQMEVGTFRLDQGEVDLARAVRQIVQDHLGAADEKGVALSLKLPPKTPKLRGDKQRLTVMITNLVGNAVKYTPSGGRVDVMVSVMDGTLRIAVSDTGIGIAEEDAVRVFEKFYRAANSAVQSVTGTGLGLAIAREIARMHGGDITLTSQLGKGSTFAVDLPQVVESSA